MPNLSLIKQFTFRCPNCNTCVGFEVPPPSAPNAVDELDKLSNTISNLICPKCNTPLGTGALKSFDAVKSYNASTVLLNISIDAGIVEIK